MCCARSSSFQNPQWAHGGALSTRGTPKEKTLCTLPRRTIPAYTCGLPIISNTCSTCCTLREHTHVSTYLDQIASYDTTTSMSEGFGALQGELCAILCSWNPYQQYAGCPSCWYVPQVR